MQDRELTKSEKLEMKMAEKVDKSIISVCDKVMKDDFCPDEYAKTVEALASLVEARASLYR